MLKNFLGFTLVEVLVAISILGIAALVAIPNYHRFNETQKLSNAATGLVSALKSAKTNAQSSISCYDNSGVAQVPNEWVVIFTTSTTDALQNTYAFTCYYLDSSGGENQGHIQPGATPTLNPIGMTSAVTLTNNIGGTCTSEIDPIVVFSGSDVSFSSTSCPGTWVELLIKLTDSTLTPACIDVKKGGVISLVTCS